MPADRPAGSRHHGGLPARWLVAPATTPPAVRAALVVIGAGWVAFLVSTFTRSGPSVLWDAWVYDSLTCSCAAVVLARAALVHAERTAWAAFALGMAFTAAGDVCWSILSASGHSAFPNAADALYLLLYPCLYVALVLLLRGQLRRFGLSTWLDGFVVACALTALVAALAFGPIMEGAPGGPLAVAVALAYPVGDLALLAMIGAAQAMLGWRGDVRWWSLTAGLLLWVVADVIYLFKNATVGYTDGGPADALWPAAMLVMAVTSWRPARQLTQDVATGWATLVPSTASTLSAVGVLCTAAGPRVPVLAVGLAAGTLLAAAARFAASFFEIAALAESRREALTDELTGFANRRALLAALDGARARPAVGLLLIDLDHFKEINDSLGHHVGDELLVQVARRLRHTVRSADLVARLGGDEFAVLLTDPARDPAAIGDPLSSLEIARRAAERIIACLTPPFALDDVTLHIRGSIGIGALPEHTDDPMQLLQRADVAMYTAKSDPSGIGVYDPHEDPHSRERLQLLEELRTSLRTGGIICHYQPKIDLRTGRAVGVEALARWIHPVQGLVPPHGFLALAERTGLMRELTATVLSGALDQARRWRAQGLAISVAVNLSPTNLLDTDLPALVARILDAQDLPPDALELEITETVMMTNADRCREVLGQLHALGVRTAVDDYGTGYSSLAYLHDLDVDVLKLDRVFVSGMTSDPRAATIVRSSIELAHSLDMLVVAEGVEDEVTAERLLMLGCDYSQGYLHSPPLSAERLSGWLQDNLRRAADRMVATRPPTT